MSALLTGTPTAVVWAAGSNPAAQNITIPSDATAVYMFWSYYVGSSAGLLSATLASASPAQSVELQNTRRSCGVCAWYSTGTGTQSLDVAWDASPSEGATCIVAYVKDGNTTSWRDADTDNDEGTTAVTVTLTTESGDLVLKFDSKYFITAPPLSSGWTSGNTQTNNVQSSRLSYIAATGTTQVCNSEDEDWSSVVAIAIGPAAAAAQSFAIPSKAAIQPILAR